MKNLVIVESPSKSKTIEKYLGEGFKVVSSKGHIRDLAKTGPYRFGVDVENDFKASYTISKDKKDVVTDLKKYVKAYDNIYLATDPDREGEAISWHLADELGLDLNLNNRVVFNEITKDAVIKAFNNPKKIDYPLVKSQETRRIFDRIIGFRLSKLLQSKIQSKSAGRVQSVALRMICDREDEINKFISEEYWTIEANFNKDNIDFKANLLKVDGNKPNLTNQQQATEVYDRLQNEFIVTSVKKSSKQRAPKLVFTTSTLQQEASTRLNFGAKKTMSVAQRLYEGIDLGSETKGLITYMRTDSTRLSDTFVKTTMAFIEDKYGKEYKGFYKEKKTENAQDAHEGIRPTDINLTPESIKTYLDNDQFKLYSFIYYRALASLMSSIKNETVSVILTQDNIDMSVNGSVQVFDGFLKVYSDYDSSKDVILPELNEKESINAKEIISEQHFTEPPSRYTEAKLIKSMEEEGIGRPSTYSTIIDTIQVRLYVELKKATDTGKTKYFYPTEQGVLTDSKLREFFSSIIDIKYTANMEKELDLIAENKQDNVKSLKTFYDKFEPLVANAYENMEKRELEKTGEKCPDCGADTVIRNGRFGKFISCSTFPTCKYTSKLNKDKTEEPEKTGIMCELCGHEMLKRKSRFGTYFLGCSNFPKCRNLLNEDGTPSKYAKKDTKAKTTKTTTKKAATKKSTTKKATTKKTTTKKAVKKSDK